MTPITTAPMKNCELNQNAPEGDVFGPWVYAEDDLTNNPEIHAGDLLAEGKQVYCPHMNLWGDQVVHGGKITPEVSLENDTFSAQCPVKDCTHFIRSKER